jgi:hypothetical protein
LTVVTQEHRDNQFSFYNGPGQQSEWLDKHGSDTAIRPGGIYQRVQADLSAHKGKMAAGRTSPARSNNGLIFAMVVATINTD